MTGRNRNYQKTNGFQAVIAELVRNTWRNTNPVAGLKQNGLIATDHGCAPSQYIKKLFGVMMVMADFGFSGRHLLFDDTQVTGFEQMPPVANFSPLVMFSTGCIDRFHVEREKDRR